MHSKSLISRNYAKAIFKLAKEDKQIDKVSGDLQKFADNFTEEFASELNNPAISSSDLTKIIELINQKIGISGLASDFLNVVFKNRKAAYFKEIHKQFVNLVKEDNNILQVEVISASELSQDNLNDLKTIVSKQAKGKEIEISQTMKAQILGGIQIKIGSNLIDASLKSQLEDLQNELIGTIN